MVYMTLETLQKMPCNGCKMCDDAEDDGAYYCGHEDVDRELHESDYDRYKADRRCPCDRRLSDSEMREAEYQSGRRHVAEDEHLDMAYEDRNGCGLED